MIKIMFTCPQGHYMGNKELAEGEKDQEYIVIDLSTEQPFIRVFCAKCCEWYDIPIGEVKERKV